MFYESSKKCQFLGGKKKEIKILTKDNVRMKQNINNINKSNDNEIKHN